MNKDTISIRLDPATIEKINELAEADRRTVSDYLRLKIEEMF